MLQHRLCMRNVGIVIRVGEGKKATYVILDQEYGKMNVFANRDDISSGSLIAYCRLSQFQNYIHKINLIDLPDIKNEVDLIFFHQVLEIAYYFLPLDKAVPDIFCILLYLYSSFESFSTDCLKKLFLVKLFSHLGFYPEGEYAYNPLFKMVRMESLEVIIRVKIDLSLERKLDRWLDYCISLHPCTRCFKAISHFMSRKP